ncbi:site-specific integrase [Chelativorans sp. YIM 93263]|uniref:site-specific integrase n=1 Tax=Chelativorans sp. YIM 93263 TaxID=2906648 RepID=UPI0023790465|nr:tyrosine-type recombinase/integrase [Chelativorans sp. YIM 93263]
MTAPELLDEDLAAIDLPYIEKNVSRHGGVRRYFRYEGKRYGRLPDDPDSEEFSREYWRLRRIAEGEGQADDGAKDDLSGRPQPGTFRWLCSLYLASDAYRRLDKTTQAKRRAIIDAMLLEPLKPGGKRLYANMPLAALDVKNIEVLRDRKASTPFAADERLKVLRQVFETTRPGRDGKREKIVKENRARLVQPFRKKSEGHHTITAEEIGRYIQHHGTASKATLAIVILMYTGLRVSDLATIGPQHRRGDIFQLRLFKNRNRGPVTLQIAIHPILDTVLAMHPAKGMNYLLTEYGKPFSIKGLGNRVSDWFDQAGLPHCTAHTVRKGLATSLAESEATDSMLDGLFGWKDGKTSKIYTAKKQQAKLARQAVLRIDWGEMGNILPHPNGGVASQPENAEKKAN